MLTRQSVMRQPTEDPSHITAVFKNDQGITVNEPVISPAAGSQYADQKSRREAAENARKVAQLAADTALNNAKAAFNAANASDDAKRQTTLDEVEVDALETDALIHEAAEKQIADREKAAAAAAAKKAEGQ